MLDATHNVTLDIETSITTAHRAEPEVFKVIRDLGLRNYTIGHCMSISNATVSQWRIGKDPIPPARYGPLLMLCREAHQEALRVIAEVAARPNKTLVQGVAVSAYAERVNRAGRLLAQLEDQFRGRQD